MKETSKILVPTDFTAVGDSAVEYAKFLSKILNASILLLHVVKNDSDGVTAKLTLEKISEKLNAEGFVTTTIVSVGNIYDDIGQVAKDNNASLIVMGTHGVKGMQHVMGSKALKVITNSDVPFVVVQKKPINTDGFKNIIIPLDFNQEIKQSIKYAWEIGKYFNAKIHIAYVKEKDEFIAQKIERNIPYAIELLEENDIAYEITGIDKKDFTNNLLELAKNSEADLITLINNHENIFTYFGGSFEQKVIGNEFEVPALVINAVQLQSSYSFSIYFG